MTRKFSFLFNQSRKSFQKSEIVVHANLTPGCGELTHQRALNSMHDSARGVLARIGDIQAGYPWIYIHRKMTLGQIMQVSYNLPPLRDASVRQVNKVSKLLRPKGNRYERINYNFMLRVTDYLSIKMEFYWIKTYLWFLSK